MGAQPPVHLVEMEGDHHSGDEIELVGGHFACGPEAPHPVRENPPVHEGHDQYLQHGADRQQEAVVPHGAPQQEEKEGEHGVELEQDHQEVELVVPRSHQVGQMVESRRHRPGRAVEGDGK